MQSRRNPCKVPPCTPDRALQAETPTAQRCTITVRLEQHIPSQTCSRYIVIWPVAHESLRMQLQAQRPQCNNVITYLQVKIATCAPCCMMHCRARCSMCLTSHSRSFTRHSQCTQSSSLCVPPYPLACRHRRPSQPDKQNPAHRTQLCKQAACVNIKENITSSSKTMRCTTGKHARCRCQLWVSQ
jgi:hypothetical protein